MTPEELATIQRWQETDWIEAARQAFLRRWYDENGDDYENSPNVYGDAA